MFKVGDRVVCTTDIDNISYDKVYTVLDTDMWDGVRAVVQVIDDLDEECWYYATRFASAIIHNPDPLVTIKQSEYDNLIEEINMLQELITELSKANVNLAIEYPEQFKLSEFKPISEYTLADWEQAYREDWVFGCRDGTEVRIMETYIDGDYVLRGDDNLTRTVDGHWLDGEIDRGDIVKRIK